MREESAEGLLSYKFAVIPLAAGVVLLHMLLSVQYGYFRDELYFIACGQHLAWGYVDQPPLIAAVARLESSTFGDSLMGLRLAPALAAGALILLTGFLAHLLGGSPFAVVLAGVTAALAPAFLAFAHTLTMNAFEPLFWTAVAALLVGMIRSGDPRPWLAVGALVGLGLLNKHSMGFFAACLILGLLLTPQRRLLRGPWPLVGAALGLVIVLPHVLWQVEHGWPMLELLRNGQRYKNMPFELGAFFSGQLLLLHPLFVPVWLSGLGFLLFAPGGRPYRALGLGFLVLLGLFVLLKAKAYYLAPAYPMLLAAGAGVVERAWDGFLPRLGILGLAVLGGAALAPLAMPILPVRDFIKYQRRLRLEPPRTERHTLGVLPQYFADQHGWRQFTDEVAKVFERLPPEERARTVIFTQNYGEASAIDWFGRTYEGLPLARSGHNQYFLWGPGPLEPEVLLLIGRQGEDFAPHCDRFELGGRLPSNPYVMPYESELPIYFCRGLKTPLATLWPGLKHYE